MDSGAAMSRAVLTAAVWAGISAGLALALGVPMDMMVIGTDAGIMGASSLASDTVHTVLGMKPTGTTAALGTGLFFAAGEKLIRGDNSYITNVVGGAVSDMVVERVALASGM